MASDLDLAANSGRNPPLEIAGELSLPIGLDLSEIKAHHDKILDNLRGKGVTYEQISRFFSLGGSSAIRNYHKQAKIPRSDNGVLKRIHNTLLFADDHIVGVIDAEIVDRYRLAVCHISPDLGEKITYVRKTGKNFSSEDMYAVSEIFHDIYNVDGKVANSAMGRIVGRYYMYKSSIEDSVIVKSLVVIEAHSRPGSYIQFTHDHPERRYSREFNNRPRRTHGIAVRVGQTINMIGNTNNGQAANFIIVKEPENDEQKIMVGFNLTTVNGIILSTRFVLVREDEATVAGIERFTLNPEISEREKFVVSMLLNPNSPQSADNTQKIIPRVSELNKILGLAG